VTEYLALAWDIRASILPVTDDRVATMVRTTQGWRRFQDFVVRDQGRLDPLEVAYDSAAESSPAAGVLAAIEAADLLVMAPSNPISSITPILAVPGVRQAIADRRGPNVAISPVVMGAAPATEAERSRIVVRRAFMEAAGRPHTPSAVAALYRDLIDGFVVDGRDHRAEAPAFTALGLPVLATDTLAPPGEGRDAFAAEVLRFGAEVPVSRDQRLTAP
jgi:LPPG:FO 2-phospho-L-lactate transferase